VRHEGAREAEAGCLPEPAFRSPDGPQLPEEPDLAEGDGAGPHRAIPQGRREGDRQRQVQSRVGDRDPAREVGVDVVRSQADPARPSTATSRASFGSGPIAVRRAAVL
jgi:hypothetical protein